MEPNQKSGTQVREVLRQEFDLDGKTIAFETGLLAQQADGALTVQMGETVTLVTAVVASKPTAGKDFLPLTVDVEEKMYAAGKIPGGFIKRETRPSEKATLTARLIDRPLRPSFPKGFYNEIQVLATILSVDFANQPDILALNGASMALLLADAPFSGPVAGVRIGRVDGKFILNPTFEDLDASDLEMIVAGNRDAILMVEAGASEVLEADVVKALDLAHDAIVKLCDFQERFKAAYADIKPPSNKVIEVAQPDPAYAEIEERVRALATGKIKESLRNHDKLERDRQQDLIAEEVLAELAEMVEDKESYVSKALKQIKKEEMRRMILDEGV
ncbi:MAG TPA: polyribonucleotide nucleotidyltransferase, partial [Actinobacteria bacterium]|nr:polyribonucleotide nucleotidyltransferase [Actinomycetota bacterium]